MLSFNNNNKDVDRLLKATFDYSSQLQTWSQAGQKPAANLLKMFFFLHSICLARARTSEPAAVRDQVLDKKKSKACQKPARTCRKPGYKPGRKPGFQLARIMEFRLEVLHTGRVVKSGIWSCHSYSGVFRRMVRPPTPFGMTLNF